MTRPTYLPAGVDPTQIEHQLPQHGCFRWFWLLFLLIGACGGLSAGVTLFGSHAPSATPTRAPTVTATVTATATPTAAPIAKPAITHTFKTTPTLAPTPERTPTVTVNCWYYHLIRQGETLNALAIHFRTTVQTLMQWNNLRNPNRILWGMYLRVKTDCSTPTPERLSWRPLNVSYF